MKYIRIIWSSILSVLRFVGRTINIFLFAGLILGVMYYFIKPDLPPQEIWSILDDISPSLRPHLETSIPSPIFEFVGIEVDPIKQESVSGVEQPASAVPEVVQ